jgi:hypothetical protein
MSVQESALQAAIDASPYTAGNVCDFGPDWVVWTAGATNWRTGYITGAAGKATLTGTPQQVEQVTRFVPDTSRKAISLADTRDVRREAQRAALAAARLALPKPPSRRSQVEELQAARAALK